MAWWTAIPLIGKVFKGAAGAVEDVTTVFRPHAEKGAQRDHEADLASLEQFAKEFRERAGATWWDSFVDGLNRLPRPLITIGVLSVFVLAPYDPVWFLEIAEAWRAVPEGFYALVAVIVGFYFGGRMQLKSQDFAVKGTALDQARRIVEQRKEFRELSREDEPETERVIREAGEPEPSGNRVVDAWLRRGGATI